MPSPFLSKWLTFVLFVSALSVTLSSADAASSTPFCPTLMREALKVRITLIDEGADAELHKLGERAAEIAGLKAELAEMKERLGRKSGWLARILRRAEYRDLSQFELRIAQMEKETTPNTQIFRRKHERLDAIVDEYLSEFNSEYAEIKARRAALVETVCASGACEAAIKSAQKKLAVGAAFEAIDLASTNGWFTILSTAFGMSIANRALKNVSESTRKLVATIRFRPEDIENDLQVIGSLSLTPERERRTGAMAFETIDFLTDLFGWKVQGVDFFSGVSLVGYAQNAIRMKRLRRSVIEARELYATKQARLDEKLKAYLCEARGLCGI